MEDFTVEIVELRKKVKEKWKAMCGDNALEVIMEEWNKLSFEEQAMLLGNVWFDTDIRAPVVIPSYLPCSPTYARLFRRSWKKNE